MLSSNVKQDCVSLNLIFLMDSLFAVREMDSSGKDREINKDEEIVKRSAGRGHRVWSQGESKGLRRPHNASTASLSSEHCLPLQWNCKLLSALKFKVKSFICIQNPTLRRLQWRRNKIRKKRNSCYRHRQRNFFQDLRYFPLRHCLLQQSLTYFCLPFP